MQLDTLLNEILEKFPKNNITNLSINSLAGVKYTISRNLDPFSRLRQCEQIIFEKTAAIEDNWLSARKQDREIQKKEEQLLNLNPSNLEDNCLKSDIEDELCISKRRKQRVEMLLRDTLMELNTAVEEKIKILEEYPDFLSKDYQSLQEEYSKRSFQRKIASGVTIKLLTLSGMPEEIATILVEMPKEEWQSIIDQANKTFCEIELELTNNHFFQNSEKPLENVIGAVHAQK